eukprot:Rhum_TRINITY_DN14467_c1_g1::Rhum_TRINITY_DN14467_c1_g1_i1::g.91761::m.91761/K12183/TSG101, STP22, VPS23; ESCRT-I complex subunit TSG101
MQTLFPPQQSNLVEERAQRANLLAWELHYHNPDAIFGHSQQLFNEFRNLEPVKGTDGTFSIRGTLEVQYSGTVYHFPLAMEVPKNYPETMPRCHIPNDMLPPGMVLSERNADLSPEGYLRVPVLPYPANNLAGNARWCAASYQKSSPVYNRTQAPTPATQPAAKHYNPYGLPQQQQQQQQPQLPATQPAYSYPPSAQNPYVQQPNNNDGVMEELAQSLRDELAIKLTTHAKDLHAKSLKSIQQDTTEAQQVAGQVALCETSRAEAERYAASMSAEAASLDAQLDELKQWIASNEHVLSKSPEELMPVPPLEAQIIEVTAQLNTADDMLHLVGRCGEDAETITITASKLARKKFEAAALLKKATNAREVPSA